MLRPQRFKQQLFTKMELQENGDRYWSRWHEVKKALPYERLKDFEKAALFLFILSSFRRPKDFLGGPHSQGFHAKDSGLLKVRDLKAFAPYSTAFQRLPETASFFDALTQMTLRSVPLSVQRSLVQWSNHNYPLVLNFEIPSPEEVLDLQCQGQRVVSLLDQRHHFSNLVEGERDTLGFLVHDLIHADHFFRDPANAQAQILFCRFLKKLQGTPQFHSRLQQNSEFQKDFHYLSSDMNSVPLHLLKSLKAILLKDFKKQCATPENHSLSPPLESAFRVQLNQIFQQVGWDNDALQALHRLNSADFSIETDYLLLLKNVC